MALAVYAALPPAPCRTVEAFANAIAADNQAALLIDTDNHNDGWTSVLDAAASGRTFAVRVQTRCVGGRLRRPVRRAYGRLRGS